jgi:hypothetical protein
MENVRARIDAEHYSCEDHFVPGEIVKKGAVGIAEVFRRPIGPCFAATRKRDELGLAGVRIIMVEADALRPR